MSRAQPDEIVQRLNALKKEVKAIHKSCTELVIYAGGSIGWQEVWSMSIEDRNVAIKVLNDYMSRKAGKDPTEYL